MTQGGCSRIFIALPIVFFIACYLKHGDYFGWVILAGLIVFIFIERMFFYEEPKQGGPIPDPCKRINNPFDTGWDGKCDPRVCPFHATTCWRHDMEEIEKTSSGIVEITRSRCRRCGREYTSELS